MIANRRVTEGMADRSEVRELWKCRRVIVMGKSSPRPRPAWHWSSSCTLGLGLALSHGDMDRLETGKQTRQKI